MVQTPWIFRKRAPLLLCSHELLRNACAWLVKGIIPPLRKELLRLKRVFTGKRVVVNGKLTSGCVTVMASTSMS